MSRPPTYYLLIYRFCLSYHPRHSRHLIPPPSISSPSFLVAIILITRIPPPSRAIHLYLNLSTSSISTISTSQLLNCLIYLNFIFINFIYLNYLNFSTVSSISTSSLSLRLQTSPLSPSPFLLRLIISHYLSPPSH